MYNNMPKSIFPKKGQGRFIPFNATSCKIPKKSNEPILSNIQKSLFLGQKSPNNCQYRQNDLVKKNDGFMAKLIIEDGLC